MTDSKPGDAGILPAWAVERLKQAAEEARRLPIGSAARTRVIEREVEALKAEFPKLFRR